MCVIVHARFHLFIRKMIVDDLRDSWQSYSSENSYKQYNEGLSRNKGCNKCFLSRDFEFYNISILSYVYLQIDGSCHFVMLQN